MESPCLFTRQRALKMGYFYWLHVKNLNHFHTELSLGYLKDTKFYLASKASFIDISSITSFRLLLIAWLREYCTFSSSSVVSLKSSPWPKYMSYFPKKKQTTANYFPKKKKNRIPLSNFLSSSNMFFIRLFLSNT